MGECRSSSRRDRSATQRGYVDALIKGLKTDGLFSILDRMWLFAAENTFQADIDIINLGTFTIHGSPTFTASQGYTGDGSAVYIDSGWTPSTAGGNMTLNSASWGVYNRTAATSDQGGDSLGAQGTTSTWNIESYAYDGANGYNNLNDNNFAGVLALAGPNSSGFWVGSRTGANARALYRNGSGGTSSSDTQVSTGLPDRPIFIFARNVGSPNRLLADQLAVVFWGAGLNSTQAGNIASRVNAYMTSLGTNVY